MAGQELDIVTLGASELNSTTSVATVEISRQFGQDGESEPIGNAPLIQCLGITALPAEPDENGHAEGVALSPCGSYTSGVIGGTDTRCADIVGKLGPGETCVHNTGGTADTRSRLLLKENMASIILGKGKAIVICDAKNNAITITGFGRIFEMSDANGIVLGGKNGKGGIRIDDDGNVTIWGTSVNLGGATTAGTTATAVMMGASGMVAVPAPNVYITL
jgi:hypothetical protein